jgi:hypothetical protein
VAPRRPALLVDDAHLLDKGRHSSDSLFAARSVTLEGFEIGRRILFRCDTVTLANARCVCEDRLIVLWAS